MTNGRWSANIVRHTFYTYIHIHFRVNSFDLKLSEKLYCDRKFVVKMEKRFNVYKNMYSPLIRRVIDTLLKMLVKYI